MGLLQDNPKGTGRIVTETVFLALDYLFVFLRLRSRRWQKNRFELSDYLILVALFFATATYANTVFGVVGGHEGQHTDYILEYHPEAALPLGQSNFAANLLWCTSVTFVKLSVLTFYLAIFGTRRKFAVAVYCVLGLTIVFYIVYIICCFVQCTPMAFYWNPTIPGGSCWDLVIAILVTGFLNLALDVLIVLLPVPVVWGLHMAKSKRIAVCFIFGVSILICILTGIRLKLAVDANMLDLSYDLVAFGVLSSLEFYLGILCACLPLLSPAASRLRRSKAGGLFSSSFIWAHHSVSRLLSTLKSRSGGSISSHPKLDSDSERTARNEHTSKSELPLHNISSPPSEGQIKVTTQWNVDSRPAL